MTGLVLAGLEVRYGAVPAVSDLSLAVPAGAIVSLCGGNGAGKTSTLAAAMGLVPHRGLVSVDGVALAGAGPGARVRAGLAYVPEGRRLFPGLTVIETLAVASRRPPGERRRRIDALLERFADLAERRTARAWELSGGQQQLLSLARALMTEPRVVLLDEPLLGLSPAMAGRVAAAVAGIAADGVAVLVAEPAPGPWSVTARWRIAAGRASGPDSDNAGMATGRQTA